ncbi:MAG TPA: putative toxin-antitoxin system toxin component, PIN family [Thermomicrobiales bacterium]|nr:putative toxin-antitoxin system toxin component, PIN family [Thermomicrobiales bacterium]
MSYVLAPDRTTAMRRCVEAGFAGVFSLIVPHPLLTELSRKVGEKPYLTARYAPEDLAHLFFLILKVGLVIPPFEEPVPSLSRDQQDDYLIAYARIADADFVVTGDKDLLVLRSLIDRPVILTPTAFVQELHLDSSGGILGRSAGSDESGDEGV